MTNNQIIVNEEEKIPKNIPILAEAKFV